MGGLSLNLGILAPENGPSATILCLRRSGTFLTFRAVRTCDLQMARMEFVSHVLNKFVITVARNTHEVGRRTMFVWTLVASLGVLKGHMRCFGLYAVVIVGQS